MGVELLDLPEVRRQQPRYSRAKYHQMGELGLLPEKTELLDGLVVIQMSKSPMHAEILSRIFSMLYDALKGKYSIRQEQPIAMDDSEPEADIALVDIRPEGYLKDHPDFAHLVIEISKTTLLYDRMKEPIFAAASIPEFWIVNLVENVLEVYRRPAGKHFAEKTIYAADESVSPLCAPEFALTLKDILPH